MKVKIDLRRAAALAALICSIGTGFGQTASSTKGQVWIGKPGITETVAQIMRRSTVAPPGLHEMKENEIEPIFRFKPQNPASPEVSQYPTPVNQGFNGRIDRTPLFSVGPSWTGGVVGESGEI